MKKAFLILTLLSITFANTVFAATPKVAQPAQPSQPSSPLVEQDENGKTVVITEVTNPEAKKQTRKRKKQLPYYQQQLPQQIPPQKPNNVPQVTTNPYDFNNNINNLKRNTGVYGQYSSGYGINYKLNSIMNKNF